ncbi:hypothetical protein D9613_001905 [Agrocybe pediades]|uniref:Ribosome biogenesis protein SLX9 n=1 Tax=Agrocybe pediades TaxID=84607 RepID=A0A8H4R672_9AGAR|nr:hypothetical protein D9613_001905 [Agrocybe pediades]
MPKASRIRQKKHHDSVKLSKTSDLNADNLSLPALPLPDIEAAVHVVNQQGTEEEVPKLHAQPTKKEKQIEKREAFLQKLKPSIKETSKSHQRRLKRKAKEQLSGGLDDLQSAIASLEKEDMSDDDEKTDAADAPSHGNSSNSKPKPGMIGKSKSAPLSKAQRKRALELERLRHPLILTNPEFSSNPFQTIRTHAKNTLLPQKVEK